jgi:ABC-type glutathione transport system ATPase component
MTAALSIENVRVAYHSSRGFIRRTHHEVRAVDGVSFELRRGETLGLVGESGCGKSTLARAIVQLTRAQSGRILFGEPAVDLCQLRGAALRQSRRWLQMVFQDPYASLDPRQTAGDIIAEPLRNFALATRRDAQRKAGDLFELVGLERSTLQKYPHEFSGGQRQRIGLARALALQPSVLICDEPVSALDVSVQAQIINLLKDLQRRLNLSMLFISHDLAVVRHIADRIAVMKSGKIVEMADNETLFRSPQHEYTRTLLAAVPRIPASG